MVIRTLLHILIGCIICAIGLIIQSLYTCVVGAIIALFMPIGILIIFYDAWFENAADKCSIYFNCFVEWLCTKL